MHVEVSQARQTWCVQACQRNMSLERQRTVQSCGPQGPPDSVMSSALTVMMYTICMAATRHVGTACTAPLRTGRPCRA